MRWPNAMETGLLCYLCFSGRCLSASTMLTIDLSAQNTNYDSRHCDQNLKLFLPQPAQNVCTHHWAHTLRYQALSSCQHRQRMYVHVRCFLATKAESEPNVLYGCGKVIHEEGCRSFCVASDGWKGALWVETFVFALSLETSISLSCPRARTWRLGHGLFLLVFRNQNE